MRFEFSTALRILFGPGRVSEIRPFVKRMGQRVLIVTGQTPSRSGALIDVLNSEDIVCINYSTQAEPSLDNVRQGTDLARKENCDLVIGFGGGSAIDTAKAIAALLANGGDPLDYLEIIGKGHPITRPSKPWIAIPTTAGSGAEVTSNAVIFSPRHHVKVSLRNPLMLAHLVIVDPEQTYSLPPHITASTGLDALTQLIEPYVSIKTNPLTDALCREGIQRAARSLLRAHANGNDQQAREDMAIASLFGGLALSNAKLGAVHGLAGPIGGVIRAPHGGICASLLPYVMAMNIKALQDRAPDSAALDRYNEIARILTGNKTATTEDGLGWIQSLNHSLKIPPLSDYGLQSKSFPDIIQKAARSSSMKGNPITLTAKEIGFVLSHSL